jgi:hypothetical protein
MAMITMREVEGASLSVSKFWLIDFQALPPLKGGARKE